MYRCGTFSTYGRKNLRDANGYISCGCKQNDFKWKFCCELCKKTVTKKVYIRWIYDDETEEHRIRPIVVCSKHRLGALKNTSQ